MISKLLWRYPFIRRLLCLSIAYFCFHAAVLESRASRRYRDVARWPVADATVQSATPGWTSYSWSGKKNRYCPEMTYSYSIAGRHYSSYNRVFDFGCWPDAYDFVAQHQPGSLIQIAYDPSDPRVSIVPASVRDPGYPVADVLGGCFFLLCLLVDLFASWIRPEPTASGDFRSSSNGPIS
jgi:Protein of unknown function (DUF3592)